VRWVWSRYGAFSSEPASGKRQNWPSALEIHRYCEAFVGSLAHLERVIDCVRSQPDMSGAGARQE
jgi:hypothetical protein